MSKKNSQYIIVTFWTLCLFSISTIPENFFLFFKQEKEFNFLTYLNFFRFILPLIIFPLLITFYLLLKKKFNEFIIYFFFYGLWQLIILLIIDRDIKEIGNYQLIISLLSLVLLSYFSYYFCSKEIMQKLLYLNLLFISLIVLFFLIKLIPEYIHNKELFSLYGSDTLNPDTQIFMQPKPRSTGISRILVIIFYFLFFFHEKIINKKIKIMITITLILIIFLISLFETRTGYVGILLFTIYYIFFTKDKTSKKTAIVFFIIIMPILWFHELKYYKINYNNYIKKNNNAISDVLKYDTRILTNTSSGRSSIYKYALEQIISNKLILGVGPQGDRKLLANYAKQHLNNIYYDNNASNALLYSYLCGGILSFTFLILIYYKIFKILLIFLKNSNLRINPLINFCFLTLCFLTTRTVFENGFALFSIDLSLCLICYLILLNKIKK